MNQRTLTSAGPSPRSRAWRRRFQVLGAATLLFTLSAPAPFQDAGSRHPATAQASIESDARAALLGGITFLERTQRQETVGDDHFEGEWPSTMVTLATIPFVAKKGTTAYDSNSFTVSSVHNSLAAVYLRQPELNAIPRILDRTIERILTYRNGQSFNFWPL